jgi:hypothetical protein
LALYLLELKWENEALRGKVEKLPLIMEGKNKHHLGWMMRTTDPKGSIMQRRFAVIVLTLFLASNCWGQGGLPQRSNAIKADVYGLAQCLTDLPGPENYVLSVEYERKLSLSRPIHLSIIADLGLYSKYYQFFRMFEWPRPDPIISIPSDGYTIQRNWSALLGGRWSVKWLGQEKFAAYGGIEPRIGVVYANALLVPYDVYAPAEKLSRVECSPRLRVFLSCLVNNHVGIEFLGELFRFRQLGDDGKRWLVTPEINLFVAF